MTTWEFDQWPNLTSLEFDQGAGGPRGESRTPNGSTLLKRKQLRQLKYSVVPVPFWEWDALEGEKEQEEFLRRKFGESE